ncbi:VCBS domain-containing protein [Desulfovibrio sp. Fe33]|uniref:VCBS domain-containing protein n=1 Tax=Desulfovibrio sp. Fe33 TaxID=3020842 RepID=UPI00234E24DE|nr:VCBS domain-containing protein [Desulfovibrio sp. Fe33]
MTNTTSKQLQVSLPGAGKTQTYQVEADTPVKFNFDLADAVFSGIDGNLDITVEGGGTVILENYQALADAGSLPLFEMVNGEQVAGDVYIYAFDGVDRNADLETAADNADTGSGAGQYSDDPGVLADGIEALGGQGNAFGGAVLVTAEETLGGAGDGASAAAAVTEPPVIRISGDDAGAVTEDFNVSESGLLIDSGQLSASDANESFVPEDILDSHGGTFSILADGSWTYQIGNDSVQDLGEVDGVNSGFSNDFTVRSASGVEHTVTVTVNGENDAPEGADFSVTGNAYDAPVAIDFDVAPITDVEDDAGASDGLDTGVVITSLPGHGTLYYNDTAVTQEDIDSGTRFDDLDNFHYVGDAPATKGVLLGSRLAEDASLDKWMPRQVDTDGDGNPDVTISASINSGELVVFHNQQNHIDHGLANASHNGLDRGEILTITFEGKNVSHAEIGFGGLGSYFHAGSKQGAQATWTAYDNGEVVASGTVNTTVMTWYNHVTGQSGVITGGDGDTFQSLTLDQGILDGQSFDKIEFGTTEATARNWYSNWELQYMDVEFAETDSFTYRPVDSEGLVNDGDAYTVTIDMLPGASSEPPIAVDDSASVHEPNELGLAHTVTANVLDNDFDPDNTQGELHLTKVTFGDTTVDFANNAITGDAVFNADGTATIQGAHGELTIGTDGVYTYTATDDSPEPGDNPTETFTYTVSDGNAQDDATLTIDITGLADNTPPTAVDDSGSGSGWITGDGGQAGEVSGSTNYTLTAERYDADSGDWVSATLSEKGSGDGKQYGVESPDDSTGADANSIENNGDPERLLIEFDDPQQSVSIKLTGDGSGQEHITAWDAQGNEITDLVVTLTSDVHLIYSSGGTDIGTVVIMADADIPNASVALKGVDSSIAATHPSGAYEAAEITGNVLANDHDTEDTDFTDGPGFPDGSTELTVTGAAAGDLDNLTPAEYAQLLEDGAFAMGTPIHGQYGDLVISADGEWTYTTHDGLAAGDYTETFTYQVSDTGNAVDYGVITVAATIDQPTLTANMDLGQAAIIDPAATEVIPGETHHINFSSAYSDDSWNKADNLIGLNVTGDNSSGASTLLVNHADGLGIISYSADGYVDESFEISHGAYPGGTGTDSMILDFGNNGFKEPQTVEITLNGVSDGESVIFTVTDTLGNTYTFDSSAGGDGTLLTDTNGSGVTLFKTNNLQYEVRGSMAGYDESNAKLIDTIAITPGAGSAFRVANVDVISEGTWEPALQAATGFLLANDYSSDNAAMEAAIVGSGVGQWGTLQIIDSSTGEWVYTLDKDIVLDADNGLHAPTVEQFTYQVTDAHGQTDTATLYVPVQYGSVQSDHGTEGNDWVHGTSGDDNITGLSGSDLLFGGSGDDVIAGGAGHDYMDGGSGDDTLFGGSGNDHLFGGTGDDTINAGDGNDTVYFGGGHDTVTLGAGADTIAIDPNYLSDNNADSMSVQDFNINEGDRIDLSGLPGGIVEISSAGNSNDLILSIDGADIAGDDITITLHGVLPATHDAFDHQVDLSAGDDLNAVIQHIINSGGHDS